MTLLSNMKPGEYYLESGGISANTSRRTISLLVRNTGDRPVQVGSHFQQQRGKMSVDQIPMFRKLNVVGIRSFVQCIREQPSVNGDGNALSRSSPIYFIHCSPRKKKKCPGSGREPKIAASRAYLVFDVAAQHQMQKVLRMFMAGYQDRRDRIIL